MSNKTRKKCTVRIMVLKSLSFLLISALMATSALLGVSASLSGRPATFPPAISPDLQIDEGPVAEAPGALPPGLAFLGKNDPTAIELAQFAIDEHNKQTNDALKFADVLETIYANGKEGKSYSLVIAATKGPTGLYAYAAKILVEGSHKKLVSFKELP